MVSCAAVGCYSNSQKNTKSLTFHRFPIDEPKRSQWTRALRRKDFVPSIHSRLCSNHFYQCDYKHKPGNKRPKLKRDAVPSLFSYNANNPPKPPRPPNSLITKKASLEVISKKPLNPRIAYDINIEHNYSFPSNPEEVRKKHLTLVLENANLRKRLNTESVKRRRAFTKLEKVIRVLKRTKSENHKPSKLEKILDECLKSLG